MLPLHGSIYIWPWHLAIDQWMNMNMLASCTGTYSLACVPPSLRTGLGDKQAGSAKTQLAPGFLESVETVGFVSLCIFLRAHGLCHFSWSMPECVFWAPPAIWVAHWLLCPLPLQAAPLLVHVSSFAAASHKKKLYVIGGGPNGKLATDKTQCYDPSTNKWILKSAMPVEAKCINAVSFQDHIYVVGESVRVSYICRPSSLWPSGRPDSIILRMPGWMWIRPRRKRRWCWSRPCWNFPWSPEGRSSHTKHGCYSPVEKARGQCRSKTV